MRANPHFSQRATGRYSLFWEPAALARHGPRIPCKRGGFPIPARNAGYSLEDPASCDERVCSKRAVSETVGTLGRMANTCPC